MLVLSRKKDQKIRIGKSIVITVLKVHGNCVSLGIEAPLDELILREELTIHSDRADQQEPNARVGS